MHAAVVVVAGTAALGGHGHRHGVRCGGSSVALGVAATGRLRRPRRVGPPFRPAWSTRRSTPPPAARSGAEGVRPGPGLAVVVAPGRWPSPSASAGSGASATSTTTGDGLYRHKLDVLVRRADPPSGAPVLVYIHGGAWVIGDKREQGLPMLHELVAARLGVRGHQLPAQPQGHVARPHRRLQAGPRLGAGPHRTSTAATPPSWPCRAAPPAGTSRRWPRSRRTPPSGSPASRTPTPRSTPASRSTASTT